MNWNFFKRLAALEAKQARNDTDISKILDAMTSMLDYTNKVEDRVDTLDTEISQIRETIGSLMYGMSKIAKPPKLTEAQMKARLAYLKAKAAKAMKGAA